MLLLRTENQNIQAHLWGKVRVGFMLLTDGGFSDCPTRLTRFVIEVFTDKTADLAKLQIQNVIANISGACLPGLGGGECDRFADCSGNASIFAFRTCCGSVLASLSWESLCFLAKPGKTHPHCRRRSGSRRIDPRETYRMTPSNIFDPTGTE